MDVRGQRRRKSKRCLLFSHHPIRSLVFPVLVASTSFAFILLKEHVCEQDGAGAVGRGLSREDGECLWPEAKCSPQGVASQLESRVQAVLPFCPLVVAEARSRDKSATNLEMESSSPES